MTVHGREQFYFLYTHAVEAGEFYFDRYNQSAEFGF